jgi:hypothetical protein
MDILNTITNSETFQFFSLFADGIKAQMAHAKSVNRKKNFEDSTDSPRHMPIGGERPRERDEVSFFKFFSC